MNYAFFSLKVHTGANKGFKIDFNQFPIACERRCVSVLYQILLFVVIRNIVNYVVIPLAQLYGTKWIEKHFDDNEK